MYNWLQEFIHNCIIHPILPFLSRTLAIKLHKWHANIAFGGESNLN